MARAGEFRRKAGPEMRVVSHHPFQRAAFALGVLATCAVAAAGGYWFGRSTADLDSSYVTSLQRLNVANRAEIQRLNSLVVEADLTRDVEAQAALALKEDIRGLQDEVAALTEEVTFYKSLMSPSSVARGLQIAEFELERTEAANEYVYRLLLTQVTARRDWVQGNVKLEVQGAEQVLPLTEISEIETYPLTFRFRYFQGLSGTITLPSGFEPESVVVTAVRRGASAEGLNRTFPWTVSG